MLVKCQIEMDENILDFCANYNMPYFRDRFLGIQISKRVPKEVSLTALLKLYFAYFF
jgi:hypothetical protein